MLKVSFEKDSKKLDVFNRKATVVTLVGFLSIPDNLWAVFPTNITQWMWQHPDIDASWGQGTKYNEIIRLEVSAKAVCSEQDEFNPVIGGRIAESRAKIKLYKFMYTLCNKLIIYYYGIIQGVPYGKGTMHTCVNSDFHGGLLDIRDKYSMLWVKESQHLGKLLEKTQ